MNIKTKNLLCYEAWMAGKPEFAGTVLRSKNATEEDGYEIVKALRGEGVDKANYLLGNIEHKKTYYGR